MTDLEQHIYQLISQSFIRLDTTDQHLMRRFGLTLTQSWALVHLAEPEGRSLSELAQLLICDKSNVTGIVDKLEEDGLATRKRGKAGDRRYTRVILTEQGHQLRKTIMIARKHMIQERLKTIEADTLHNIHQSLQQLTSTLNTQFVQGEEPEIIEHAFEQSHSAALPNAL